MNDVMVRLRGRREVWWLVGGACYLAAIEALFGRTSYTHPLGIPFPNGIPLGELIWGAITGTLYGLMAFGIILVYRASRIINFAQAGLGTVPALLGIILIANEHVPWVVALLVVIVAAVLTGYLVEALIMRRFSAKPRLIVTVVTIGIAQLMELLGDNMPTWITGQALGIPNVPTPWRNLRVQSGTIVLNGNYFAIVILGVLVLGGLALFFRSNRIGIAIRASAENADRACMLGIPVPRLTTLVWVIATVLSALAVFFQAPVLGTPLGASISPTLLLYGLAAAIFAGMESLPVALVAGMGIGILNQSAFFGTSKPDLSVALMLPVVLVGLLVRRQRAARALDTGVSSFRDLQEFRPVPVELRAIPLVRVARIAFPAAALGFIFSAPYIFGTNRAGFLALIVIYAIAGVSLVILTGWAGQISIGQMGFAGVGGAVAGGLAVHHGTDFIVTLIAAAAAGAVVAVLIGLPALRIRGLFLAVVTLAFAFTVDNLLLDVRYTGWLLPGTDAVVGRPMLWGRIDTSGDVAFFYVCLVVLFLAYVVARGMRASRWGRVLIGVRDNMRAAQSFGVDVRIARLSAFAVSGAIAAVAGALLVYQQGALDQPAFLPDFSIDVFIFAVVGGLTSLPGTIAGACIYEGLKFLLPANLVQLDRWGIATSAVLILNFAPGGLAQAAYQLRDFVLRRIAARRNLLVPSLVADRGAEEPEIIEGDEPTRPAVTSADAPPGLLSVRSLEVSYDGVQVLFGVDIDVYEGEIVALLGTNGAGKSTVLRAISGLVPARRGRIVFDGMNITSSSSRQRAMAGIVHIPGGRGIFPTLTVAEHFRVGAWLDDGAIDIDAAVDRVLDRFPRLRDRWEQLAGNLSGGEQQQLAIGMALLKPPRLLVVDELSLGLAPTVVADLLAAIRELNEQGTTVLLVEQSINVALLVSKRAYFLEKGEVKFAGDTSELVGRDDIARSIFLAGASTKRTSRAAARAAEEVIKSIDERPVRLEARELTVSFGGLRAVDEVSFSLHAGETLGLIGPNGAGKTTVFDVVCGFLRPSRGRVLLLGRDVTDDAPDQRARAGLGRGFQDARLFPSLTVAENIAVALERHLDVRDPVASGCWLPAAREQEIDVAWSVHDLIELLSFGAFRDKFVSELSTGSRRVVELAMAVAHDPDVLVLDEPSSGIAQRETEALAPLLRRIRDETGCAMLVVEHDMGLVAQISDRLIALDLGRVIAEGTPEQVLAHEAVVAAYLGRDEALVRRSGTNLVGAAQ